MFETTLSIPTNQLREFTARLNKAGFTVLDTGRRVGTEEGPDAEATVRLLHIPLVEILDPSCCELGIRA